jgi:hypothetical protein
MPPVDEVPARRILHSQAISRAARSLPALLAIFAMGGCRDVLDLDRCHAHPELCFTVELSGTGGPFDMVRVDYWWGDARRVVYPERYVVDQAFPISLAMPVPPGVDRDVAAPVMMHAWGFHRRATTAMGTAMTMAPLQPALPITLGLVADTCHDLLMDSDETDVDCGGARCAKCAVGKWCHVDSDCEEGAACMHGRCDALPDGGVRPDASDASEPEDADAGD